MVKGSSTAPADLLLEWYDRQGRDLPWRSKGGVRADPYHVWLSEVMLQQTTVAAVIPYFHKFLAAWPTVEALAAAELDAVLVAWAGLGYYARARNLHRCARMVAERHGGQFPQDQESLRALPGIGEYTAAAIAAIAFDQPAVVMDGNIERVVARYFALKDPLPSVKPLIKQHVGQLTPSFRPGDYAQGMMDLGATICTPRKPACVFCPLMAGCEARALAIAETLPAKAPRPERPRRFGIVFWARNGDAVLLRRRPESGLLGGMMEFPSTDWRDTPWNWPQAGAQAPMKADWRRLPGLISHVFTHFQLQLGVVSAASQARPPAGAFWCPIKDLPDQALPTVMRKVAHHAITSEK